MKKTFMVFLWLFCVVISGELFAQSGKGKFNLQLQITDKKSKEPLFAVTCQIKSLGIFGITDFDGKTVLAAVPEGEYEIEVKSLGYQTYLHKIRVDKALTIPLSLEETTLMLKEVVVTAQSSAKGSSTGSTIGRQAIDHMQANSLKDLMELIPGQVVSNSTMMSAQTISIRTLGADVNNSFGASIIVDGVPMSNNTAVGTAAGGVDLRAIQTDDIESVEIIRGIPSAEYGDLSSGAVVVKSKTGETPWDFRLKLNPTTTNFSFGKGFRLPDKSSLNTSFNYTVASGDPRMKTSSFDRLSASVNHAKKVGKLHVSNKLSFNSLVGESKLDPDQVQDGQEQTAKDIGFRFSHDGKLSLRYWLSRTFSYVVGFSYSQSDFYQYKRVATNGYMELPIAMESGYYETRILTQTYYAGGGTKSSPLNLFAKVSNNFNAHVGDFRHLFGMGAEYRLESNNGVGKYNSDINSPLYISSGNRPRSYADIPSLHQVSAYLEDNMSYKIGKRYLRLNAGVRFTMLQPGMEEQVWSLSPRLNFTAEIFKWWNLRAGFGISSKTPGLSHLYPDKKYSDRTSYSQSYTMNGNPEILRYVLMHTDVYEVLRSDNLQNMDNKKFEIGFDFNLPKERSIGLIYYNDRVDNGFGNFTEQFVFLSRFYGSNPLVATGKPQNPHALGTLPQRVDTVWSSKGKYGNTKSSVNQGLEIDVNLGYFKAINTSFFVTGAYMETRSWDMGPNFGSIQNATYDRRVYVDANVVPLKLQYQAGKSISTDRRFSTMFRGVYNIPKLGFVFSAGCQVIWYSYAYSETLPTGPPIAYLTVDPTDLSIRRREITPDMLADETYQLAPGVKLADQYRDGLENQPVNGTPSWLVNVRLTKQISRYGSISFYANNFIYYEPWKALGVSTTLNERNTGSFGFGVELNVKL